MTLLDKKLNILRVFVVMALILSVSAIVLSVTGFAGSFILKLVVLFDIFFIVESYIANNDYEYELYWFESDSRFFY